MESWKPRVFTAYSKLLYQNTGISINENKKYLLYSKLSRLLRNKSFNSVDSYFELLTKPGNQHELQEFINMMTTNTTEFFREKDHFDFILNQIEYILRQNPRIQKDRVIRVWSAACSTGQEPVTLAMILKEALGNKIEIKILATDVSSQVLAKAMTATYTANECQSIPPYYLQKYFIPQREDLVVNSELSNLITYRLFNLMEPYKFRWGFDMIWCRNAMIYFNSQVQQRLVDKFNEQLVPGGLFLVGHSESLLNKQDHLHPVGHAIYVKV